MSALIPDPPPSPDPTSPNYGQPKFDLALVGTPSQPKISEFTDEQLEQYHSILALRIARLRLSAYTLESAALDRLRDEIYRRHDIARQEMWDRARSLMEPPGDKI